MVLDSELLNFKVQARTISASAGSAWSGRGSTGSAAPLLASGRQDARGRRPRQGGLEVAGAFSAKSFGIDPQPIALRVFVEDYSAGSPPGRLGAVHLFILTPEQHAIWLTEQLSKWHRQSLEVRDRELQLYETNKQLRALTAADLDKPENRKKLDAQAAAEQANGRRLSGLVLSGEDLVKQAMRNPEFGVGHLERWAEMLQILKDISANRMPSVASLLKEAAQAPKGPAAPSARRQQHRARRPGKTGSSGRPSPIRPPPASPAQPKPPTAVPRRRPTASRPSSRPRRQGSQAAHSPPRRPRPPGSCCPRPTLTGGVKSGAPGRAAPPPPWPRSTRP